eukprot:sb/3461126/
MVRYRASYERLTAGRGRGDKAKKRSWKRRSEYLDDKTRKRKQPRPDTRGVTGDWKEIPKENAAFEAYYKALGIIPEDQWDTFMEYLRKDLPSTFRVVDARGDCTMLNNLMKEQYFSKLDGVIVEGQEVKPELLPWYPNGLAWQMNMTRPMLRKCEQLFELHQFMISEVERGSIARQEAVSMIPPLCLDVKSHHTVLDMCAAPGSKTIQLLEALHADGPSPTGLVIANDGDNKRCYMLSTQTKRLNSLAFMITNEDATRFPNLKVYNSEGQLENMKYDRILCDVPCSGDGTMRKNYAIWKKWDQYKAIGIHKLQRRILLRAMDMLAEGGRIVYSTCSLNPLENEATVLSCLKNRSAFRLLPTDDLLPELKRVPGITKWRVLHSSGTWYDRFEDVDEKHLKAINPTMFPDGAEEHNMQYCMRVYPHLQNTGGFFICVIERKPTEGQEVQEEEVKEVDGAEVKKEGEDGEEDGAETAEVGEGEDQEVKEEEVKEEKKDTIHTNTNLLVDNLKFKKYSGFREDPYMFLDKDADAFIPIKEWYSVKDEFPFDNIFARSSENTKQRNLSVACRRIRDIIQNNEKRIKIINCGLKLFSYCKPSFSNCPYRLVQSGIHYSAQFLGSRLFTVCREDMERALSATGVPKHTLTTPGLTDKLMGIPTMIIIFHLPAEGLRPDFWLCIYSTENNIKSYVTEEEKNHFRLLLGMEPLMTVREKRKLDAMEKFKEKKRLEGEGAVKEEGDQVGAEGGDDQGDQVGGEGDDQGMEGAEGEGLEGLEEQIDEGLEVKDEVKEGDQYKAIGIHKLQRRILLRAMDMLAEGGRIVYSTCSLNPLENEATVLSCLKNRSAFRLLPTDDLLPELKRVPGITKWRVLHSSGTWYDRFEDVDEKHLKAINPTMFPDGAEEHNMQYCMRVYPHLQNTGGFFICVIERKPTEGQEVKEEEVQEVDDVEVKKEGEDGEEDGAETAEVGEGEDQEVKEEEVKEEKKDTIHTNTNLLVDNLKFKKYSGFREDPYMFLDKDADAFVPIKEWYSVKDEFPFDNIFARSSENTKQRNLSVACRRIRDIIQNNEKRIKIINCGLKLFSYNCPYRLVQSGIHYSAQFLGSRLFTVCREDMERALSATGVPKHTLTTPGLTDKLMGIPTMIIIFHLPAEGLRPDFWICIYSTENNIKSYVTEEEKNHFRLLLGMEPLMTVREKRKLDAMEKFKEKKRLEAEGAVKEEGDQVGAEGGDDQGEYVGGEGDDQGVEGAEGEGLEGLEEQIDEGLEVKDEVKEKEIERTNGD